MQQNEKNDTPAEYHKDANVGGDERVRGRGRRGYRGGAFTSDNWRSDQYDFNAGGDGEGRRRGPPRRGRGGPHFGEGRGKGDGHRAPLRPYGAQDSDQGDQQQQEHRDPAAGANEDFEVGDGAERPYGQRQRGRGGFNRGGRGVYRGGFGRHQQYAEGDDQTQQRPRYPYHKNENKDDAVRQRPDEQGGEGEEYEGGAQRRGGGAGRWDNMNERGDESNDNYFNNRRGKNYRDDYRRGGGGRGCCGGGEFYRRGGGGTAEDRFGGGNRRDAGARTGGAEEGEEVRDIGAGAAESGSATANNANDNSNNNSGPPRRVQRPPHMRQNCHDEDEVLELFGTHHQQTNITLDNYANIPVEMVPRDIMAVEDFAELCVEPPLTANIERCGYKKPTPVQRYGIPVALAGNDLMACAQTGSGKTAAFLIPVIQHILVHGVSLGRNRKSYPIALVMAPTRELALQIFDEVRKLAFKTDIMYEVAYGGTPYPRRYEIDVLVACPGRLKDIFDRGNISFQAIKFLILDEADRMLEMGFEEQIEYLVASSYTDMPPPEGRQTLMFSATFPQRILNLAKRYLRRRYYLLTVGRVGSTTKNITQVVEKVEENNKIDRLFDIIFSHKKTDLVLVFVETKRAAEELHRGLRRENIPSSTIHGDRTQRDRERALAEFKSGDTPILVATDVAARGLDIPNVTHVIQFDLPTEMDDYTHRIGRTGRAGNKGTATSFYNNKNQRICLDLFKYMTEHEQEVPRWFKEEADLVEGEAMLSRGTGFGRRGGGGGHRREEVDDNSTWGDTRGGGDRPAGGRGAVSGGRGGNSRKPTSAFADVDDGGF